MRKLGHREVITKATQPSVEELGFQMGILASKHLFRIPTLQLRCTDLHRGAAWCSPCLGCNCSLLRKPVLLWLQQEQHCGRVVEGWSRGQRPCIPTAAPSFTISSSTSSVKRTSCRLTSWIKDTCEMQIQRGKDLWELFLDFCYSFFFHLANSTSSVLHT